LIETRQDLIKALSQGPFDVTLIITYRDT